MRRTAALAVLVLIVSLFPMGTASAASGGVRYTESYRAQLPLTRKATATISVYRYTSVGAGSVTTALDKYYGCLTVYQPKPKSRYGYRYFYRCNDLEVMQYEFDPQMNRMKLKFDMPSYWSTYGYTGTGPSYMPASVSLRIKGGGAVREHSPTLSSYSSTTQLHKWGTRRASARGKIYAPGIGTRWVKPHHPRRGLFERRVSAYASGPYLPPLPTAPR